MIPKRLKAAREKAGLTQEQLGVAAGITEESAYSRLSHYESGRHTPKFEIACAFARILNVPECYFYIVDDDFAEEVLKLYLKNHR